MIREVHHYCSPSVFLSLLKYKEVWLTSLTQSNDHLEGIWMLRHWLDLPDNKRGDQARLWKKGAREAVELVLHGSTALGTCFSEVSDLLSQWRGYAQDGAGFSVTFDRFKIEEAVRNHSAEFPLEFCKVSYGGYNQETTEVVRQLAHAFSDDADKYKESNGIGRMALEFTEEKHQAQQAAAASLFTVKNPAFSEEKEWRLFLFQPMGDINNLEFRESKGLISPFVRLKLPSDSILGVTIGPTNRTPKVVIEKALEVNEVNGWVARSEASYRNG